MSERVELPDIFIWTPEYIQASKLTNRCTCSPDGAAGIYWGNACRRHDDHYKFIAEQKGILTRWRLRYQADQLLHDGIMEAFMRAGKVGKIGKLVADTYKIAVRRVGWTYLLANFF